MNDNYGRDLDLNLLRVFVVVAEAGGVTKAAARLYLTQPAISAALRRLTRAVGTPLFARHGRGLVLTGQGERLVAAVRPHLQALVDSTLATPPFDPATSDRVLRLGLSDATELWLLPDLLRLLDRHAPRMRIIVVPVQFRTIADAFAERRVDVAVTVADEMPASVRRERLFRAGFVCLHDPRHVRLGKSISERDYFAHDHVIVSYNHDFRGLIEDITGKQRRVRCSLASFAPIGDLVDGSRLLATVPQMIARHAIRVHPHLRTARLPFRFGAGPGLELLWPIATDDDPACRFVRDHITAIAKRVQAAIGGRPPRDFRRIAAARHRRGPS